MEYAKCWILNIQTSKKETWFGESPNGKNIASSPRLIASSKLNILMYLFPIILDYLVDILKNQFGFDEAFNYKEEQDLDATLKK
ncbi:hypothetical protein TSUD_256890 [Trifolium subterraneum]|uniref:Uncharacterized protein n=1 Tax=Trifolium subterraneum TaxID=3900 RepID=A0A2Z6M8Z4_TRISU|nr:hypothetical protein TSUD_256890 [Trifolium subterraneum]